MNKKHPIIEKILSDKNLYKEKDGKTYLFIDRLESTFSEEEFLEICKGDLLEDDFELILSWDYEETSGGDVDANI